MAFQSQGPIATSDDVGTRIRLLLVLLFVVLPITIGALAHAIHTGPTTTFRPPLQSGNFHLR